MIRGNSLLYPKSIYDVFFYEPDHIFSRDIVHQDCFNPHCEITSGCQYPFMSFAGGRVYLADHIHALAPKWPWFDDVVHGACLEKFERSQISFTLDKIYNF